MLFTNNISYDLIGIVVSIIVVTIAYFKWSLGYWKRRGVETPTPTMPFGNAADIFLVKKSMGEVWRDIYFTLKAKGVRHGGAYMVTSPIYIPIDLEIVKNILQNDFQHFVGHGVYVNEEADPLSANLFNLDGHKWKSARVKLSPTFTSGKMKMMTQTLIDCSSGLKELLDDSFNKNEIVDIKDVMARFTTDVIGSCAFGIDCNSMKNPNSEFRKYGMLAVEPGVWNTFRSLVPVVLPHKLLHFIKYQSNPPEVTKFFLDIVNDTIAYREKNNVDRKDFMHLLLQLKNKGTLIDDEEVSDKKENTPVTMTTNEIAAQSFIFFVAGFETSSTTMNFATYELAVNLDIQDKLREEINRVLTKHDKKLTYDSIMEMTYLDKVLYETLRKYPPLPEVPRVCNKDYKVPGTDVVIEKGIIIMIPIWGIHSDPDYYPDPDKFDPERFDEENKAERPSFSWLPFGEGPRICIGLRFGLLQSKIGLITLLKNYKFTLNKNTELPIAYKRSGIISAPKGTIWIDLHKIED